MNKNNRVFVTFAISLQVFILLFATMVAPAGATEDSPVLLFLYGNISLDGEPAPIGTEIVVKLNEDVVGSSSVYHEGLYGDEPNKRFSITCDPENYGDTKFYVNGNEAQIVNPADLENAKSWHLIGLDLIAKSPADSNSGNGGSSGGGSGVSTGTATDTAVPGGAGVPDGAGEAAAGSTPGGTTTSEAEPSQMDKPISPVVIIAIIAIIGIAAFAIYKKLQ